MARGLFALYLLMLVAWGSQPDARGHLAAALGIVIASIVGVMALGLPRTLLFFATVLVNGFLCKNCTDVDYAKKHIDPAHPKSGPYGIDAKEDPSVKQTAAVAKPPPGLGAQLDISA